MRSSLLVPLVLLGLLACTKNAPETRTTKEDSPTVPKQTDTTNTPPPKVLTCQELFGGMIHTRSSTPGGRESAGSTKIRTVFTVKTAQAFADLKGRVPRNYISKGPSRPNTDPILTATVPDFAKRMLVVVEYDYMWTKPVVEGVTRTAGSLNVKARFAEKPPIVQHAYGVGSYTAVLCDRTDEAPRLVP